MSEIDNQDNQTAAPEVKSDAAARAEVARLYRPGIHDILNEFFKEWKFIRQGEEILSEQVFSDVGFMPLLTHIASTFYEDNFREIVPVGVFSVSEDDAEDSIFGLRSVVNMDLAKPHQTLLLTIVMTYCCCDMFGEAPCRVDLDKLEDWARDVEQQSQGLPDVAEKAEATGA